MKVTLAWPADRMPVDDDGAPLYPGVKGGADETVDVADDVANRLIRDGLARHPDTKVGSGRNSKEG